MLDLVWTGHRALSPAIFPDLGSFRQPQFRQACDKVPYLVHHTISDRRFGVVCIRANRKRELKSNNV